MKNRKELYIKYIGISIVVTGLVVAAVIFMFTTQNSSNPSSSVVYSNEFYTLKGKPTDLQKQLFRELTAEIEKDDASDLVIVNLVTKNFIADYFTWSNKAGPFDVGGLDFVYGLENLNFRRTSREYFYSYIYTYLDQGLTLQDMIEVVDVVSEGAAFAAPYEYYDQEIKAYYIEISWTYKESELIDVSLFPTMAAMTIIVNEEGRYEIVRFY